jgi:hypothetical protein
MKNSGMNHLRTYFWWEWWWPADFFTTEKPEDWVARQGWTGKLNNNFEAIKKARDFVVGSEYFSWSDEWWKNVTPDA